MNNMNVQNGSRWWKIDFHTHTPCSRDYTDGHATPADWVRAAVANGLDAVVVADHNSGEWIDRLKDAVKESGSRLVIIPGAEITVDDGRGRIHLLAVFDPSVSTAEVTAALGACGIDSGFGDHESCHTTQSIQSVATIMRSKRGLLIPAHVDGSQGLLHGLARLNEAKFYHGSLRRGYSDHYRRNSAVVGKRSSVRNARSVRIVGNNSKFNIRRWPSNQGEGM